jgi:DtxR family Mn-dependent transcriptional regulator
MLDAAATSPSSSVGDYLKAVWDLTGFSGAIAGTKDVADKLSVSPASVTNMFVRLQEMGLVEYERYRGVSLTGRGRSEALRLVRRHRLIETFLLEHLGYTRQEVHEEAERLEHAVSDGFTERLAELLGHPGHDPHGDPIPAADGTLAADDSFPLGEAAAGARVRVRKVADDDATVLAYLEEQGLIPGCVLEVVETRALDGVVTVRNGEETRSLGQVLTRAVFVRAEREQGSSTA